MFLICSSLSTAQKSIKNFSELGGFHHDSPNSRLQHEIQKKQDPRYENTKPIDVYLLIASAI